MSESLTRTGRCETGDGADLAARIRAAGDATIGVEEEFILVDRAAMPVAAARDVARHAGEDPCLRVELPDCQVEVATPPRASLDAIEADLRRGRSAVQAWCPPETRPISAAVHPQAVETGVASARAQDLVGRFGWLARSQLLASVQVHVALGDPQVTVAVHDEMRAHLPLITALAAAAPFHGGRDLGLATVRPFVSVLLPRQGIPPAFGTLEAYVADLEWLVASGAAADPTEWWWDLRIHPHHGTLEVRVADAQPSVGDAMGVVEFVVALVRHLGLSARHGDLGPPAPSWHIDENRRSAARGGLDAPFRDAGGRCRSVREVLTALVDRLEDGPSGLLDRTRALMASPVHERLRVLGPRDSVRYLAEVFAS